MSADLLIRPVNATEAATLVALSRKTFFDAFAHRNTPGDMALYADANLTVEKVDKELQNPDSYFFFALIDESIVGYLKLNRGTAQTDLQDAEALEIERIYVDALYQGKQLGTKLIDFVISRAQEWQSSYIWLGVWEHNTQAIKFYKRHGFVEFGSHPFTLGTDRQTDILMKLELEQ